MKNAILRNMACLALVAAFTATASAQDMSIVVLSGQSSELFPDGNPYYTATRDVVIAWTNIPSEAVEFAITQTEDSSGAVWLTEYPISHSITGDEGTVTIYAWVRDEAEQIIAQASDTMTYSTATNFLITDIQHVANANSIQIDWYTLDAADPGIDVFTVGWLTLRCEGETVWNISEPTEYSFNHNILLTGLVDNTNYEIVLYSNDASQAYPVTTAAATPTEGNVTWTGSAAPDLTWAKGYNWTGLQPPANPTAATINFNASDTTGESNLGEPDDGVWEVGNLVNTDVQHTLNLSGNRLIVTDNIAVPTSGSDFDAVLDITGGTLQIGKSEEDRGRIEFGGYHSGGTLKVGAGTTVEAYLSLVYLSAWAPRSEVDFRGATIAGGTLAMHDLTLGGAPGGRVLLSDATTMSALQITGDALIGERGTCFVGDTGNDYRLPEKINIILGVDENNRGSLNVGTGHADATFSASSGGTLTAYLSTLGVGRNVITDSASCIGEADFAPMDSCTVNITDVLVGTDRAGYELTDQPRGTLTLPGGSAVIQNATIGGHSAGYGLMTLDTTDATVTDQITLNPSAAVTINVGDTPTGLTIDGDAVFDGGTININFESAPTADIHWGLRWKGDHFTALSGQLGTNKITCTYDEEDPGFEGKRFGVKFDDLTGYTCVGIIDDEPAMPVAVAKDASFEIEPGGTVLVGTADIDNGSFDPDERPFTLTMTCGEQQDVSVLELTETGEHTVTLTITVIQDEVPIQSSDTCTVSIFALPAAVETNVTWLGEASTSQMDRREWLWSGNWLEGAPPAVITPARIIYGTRGQSVKGIVETDRTVGGVTVSDSVHSLDLDANTLTVAGSWLQEASYKSDTFQIENGTLKLGSDSAPGSMSLASYQATSILQFRNGGKFHTYDVSTISIGSWGSQARQLDLAGAEVVGGVFDVGTLTLGNRGQLLMDNDTVISEIKIRSALSIQSTHANSYIGDVTEEKMPAGVDFTLGVDELNPASVSIPPSKWAKNKLVARLGGTLTAYCSTVLVGGGTGTGTLDLSAMSGGTFSAETVRVADETGIGLLALPPCSATAGTVTVGGTGGSGTLRLNGTTFAVADSLSVSSVGKIVTDVGATSCGLDLPGNPEFVLTLDGVIEINFLELPAPGSDPHYGLRWAGDQQAAVENLIAADKIVPDYSALIPEEPEGGGEMQSAENGGDMFAIDVQFDGNYTYVALIADVPAVSEYAFSYDVPEQVFAGVDTVVPVTFANVEPAGDLGYDAAAIAFEATGPGDVTFTLDAYSVVNSGYWGGEAGFVLPAVHSQTGDWTLNFSEAGQYSIVFRCYEIGDEANPFAEDSVVVEVELAPIYGDANRDGTVDLLDLVFVRNRLFADIEEDDNRQADINDDDTVDLQDLIEVRNNLGATGE